jgi:hypothetical protein
MNPVLKHLLKRLSQRLGAILALILGNGLLVYGNFYAYDLLEVVGNLLRATLFVSLFYAIVVALITRRPWRDGLRPALVMTGSFSGIIALTLRIDPFFVLSLNFLSIFAVALTFLISLLLAASGKWTTLRKLLVWHLQLLAIASALFVFCALAIT